MPGKGKKSLGKRFRNQNVSDGHQMEQKQFVFGIWNITWLLTPIALLHKGKGDFIFVVLGWGTSYMQAKNKCYFWKQWPNIYWVNRMWHVCSLGVSKWWGCSEEATCGFIKQQGTTFGLNEHKVIYLTLKGKKSQDVSVNKILDFQRTSTDKLKTLLKSAGLKSLWSWK